MDLLDIYLWLSEASILDKLTLAVRETGVSRHNGIQLRNPLKPHNTLVLWWSNGFQKALNCDPMMPRDAMSFGQLYVWSLLFSSLLYITLKKYFSSRQNCPISLFFSSQNLHNFLNRRHKQFSVFLLFYTAMFSF